MDLEQLRSFFMWCTIINWAMLMLWALVFFFAHGWVYRIHSHWFKISPERFDYLHYLMMGQLKIFIFVFNLVPFVALSILRG